MKIPASAWCSKLAYLADVFILFFYILSFVFHLNGLKRSEIAGCLFLLFIPLHSENLKSAEHAQTLGNVKDMNESMNKFTQ